MVSISGRLYSWKKSRFDRLHVRNCKASTFCPQMVMGGQQRDTSARTCGIDVIEKKKYKIYGLQYCFIWIQIYLQETALKKNSQAPPRQAPNTPPFQEEKSSYKTTPHRFQWGLRDKTLLLRFLENITLYLKKTNANCSEIISNGLLWVSSCQIQPKQRNLSMYEKTTRMYEKSTYIWQRFSA